MACAGALVPGALTARWPRGLYVCQWEALNYEERGVLESLRQLYSDREGHLFADEIESSSEEEDANRPKGMGAAARAALKARLCSERAVSACGCRAMQAVSHMSCCHPHALRHGWTLLHASGCRGRGGVGSHRARRGG